MLDVASAICAMLLKKSSNQFVTIQISFLSRIFRFMLFRIPSFALVHISMIFFVILLFCVTLVLHKYIFHFSCYSFSLIPLASLRLSTFSSLTQLFHFTQQSIPRELQASIQKTHSPYMMVWGSTTRTM